MKSHQLRLFILGMLSLILLWFVLPVFGGILNIGNITGVLLFGGLLLFIVNLHKIRTYIKMNQRSPLVFLLIAIKMILILAILTAMVESFFELQNQNELEEQLFAPLLDGGDDTDGSH